MGEASQAAGTVVVAVEGIDRAGKTTQTALLERALRATGATVGVLSFPRYESFFGARIRRLLDGDGATSAATVDPRSMSLWYALDRWDAFRRAPAVDVLLLNRYTLSNAVYQSARVAVDAAGAGAPPEPGHDPAADELFGWLLELEHGQLGLPRPALTVVLDVGPEVSRERSHRPVPGPAAPAGTAGPPRSELPDVYERSAALLAAARTRYLWAAATLDDVVVVPSDDGRGVLVGPAEVHQRVMTRVSVLCGS